MILLQQALLSIAEPALNKALKHDYSAEAKLAALENKSLSVELTDIQLSLNVAVFGGLVRLSTNIDARDCYVKTELSHLKKLSDAAQITSLIKKDMLELEGELSVAQKFSALFMENNIDWEEWLSRYVGDALTHKLFRKGDSMKKTFSKKKTDLDYTLHSALTDELRLTPSSIELDVFSNQVDRLAAKSDKLEIAIQSLKDKL